MPSGLAGCERVVVVVDAESEGNAYRANCPCPSKLDSPAPLVVALLFPLTLLITRLPVKIALT